MWICSSFQAETRAEFAERSVAKLEKTIDDLEGMNLLRLLSSFWYSWGSIASPIIGAILAESSSETNIISQFGVNRKGLLNWSAGREIVLGRNLCRLSLSAEGTKQSGDAWDYSCWQQLSPRCSFVALQGRPVPRAAHHRVVEHVRKVFCDSSGILTPRQQLFSHPPWFCPVFLFVAPPHHVCFILIHVFWLLFLLLFVFLIIFCHL